MAFVDAGERGRRNGQGGEGQDMTGIANKAGQTGCSPCYDPKHWRNRCPYKDVTSAELALLRKKNKLSPRLMRVRKEGKSESDDDMSLGDLKGVALVLPAAGIIVRLDPANTRQVKWDCYGSHQGLGSTLCGVANILSIPELERMGYRVQSDTYADWVVTSPKGTELVLQKDTGHCEGLPFVYLNDLVVVEFFGKICEENIERITQEISSEHFPLPRPYRDDYHPALVHSLGWTHFRDIWRCLSATKDISRYVLSPIAVRGSGPYFFVVCTSSLDTLAIIKYVEIDTKPSKISKIFKYPEGSR